MANLGCLKPAWLCDCFYFLPHSDFVVAMLPCTQILGNNLLVEYNIINRTDGQNNENKTQVVINQNDPLTKGPRRVEL